MGSWRKNLPEGGNSQWKWPEHTLWSQTHQGDQHDWSRGSPGKMLREEAEIKGSHVHAVPSVASVTTVKALPFSERKGNHCSVLDRGII